MKTAVTKKENLPETVDKKEKSSKNSDSFINIKSFITALVIIAALMVLSYIATLAIPCGGIPFWKWAFSPILVLGSDDMVTLLAVIVFLLVIGGVFNALTNFGVMRYMIDKIADKYSNSKYKLMAVIIFFFMALGSLIGSFEEVVPMVPIVCALTLRFGWDPMTGLSMSLLAVGCGFAAGVFNPFTIGIAQELAGLAMFSGAWFRAINFVLIYILLFLFTRHHAMKVERTKSRTDAHVLSGPGGELTASGSEDEISSDDGTAFVRDVRKDRAVIRFAVLMILGILIVLSSAFITALRDYTFVIVSVTFLIAGIVSCKTAGMSGKELGKSFLNGSVSMLPAVLMILMASSIKYTLSTAGALDYVVQTAIQAASHLPGWSVILFIYLIVLLLNFVIASGSAKAVMLTPLLVALAEPFGISAQLVCVAFAFGDGFSNTFYATNPALLISLGLADVSYVDWAKHSGKFQLMNLVLTSAMLLVGLAIGLQ